MCLYSPIYALLYFQQQELAYRHRVKRAIKQIGWKIIRILLCAALRVGFRGSSSCSEAASIFRS